MEEHKIAPVIDASNVVVKKKSIFKRFADVFVEKDVREVAEEVKKQHIIPAIKNMIITAGNSFLTSMLYKDNIPRGNMFGWGNTNTWTSSWNGVSYGGPNINYSGAANKQPTQSLLPNYVNSWEDILIQPNPAKGESMEDAARKAQQVISCLVDQINRYHQVTIGDLYDACGLVAPATYNNYGWKDLNGSTIKCVQGGFKFVLPDPIPLRQ